MLLRIIKDDSHPSKTIVIISMRIFKDLKNLPFGDDIDGECMRALFNPDADSDKFRYFDMAKGEEREMGLDLEPDRDFGEDLVSQALSRFIDCYSFNLKELSKDGWFLDWYIERKIPKIYEEKFDEETLRCIKAKLPKYYRKRYKNIIKELTVRHVHRKDYIINEIVKGYKKGKGTIRLAILGVISQIDGICSDELNKLFFIKHEIENKYVPVVTGILPNAYSDLLATHLDVIIEDSPIYTHYSNLDKFSSKLNRHTAVHGMDLNYGGEDNFWKILSLFKFVSDALYFFDDSKFETRNLVITSRKY